MEKAALRRQEGGAAMREWVVTLPGLQNYNLESDTPAEDLAGMGYSVFGLMELDEPAMKRWWKYPLVPPAPPTIRASAQAAGRDSA